MNAARFPRLLNSDLSEARRIQPVDGSLNLTIVPLSTASLAVLTAEAAPIGSWVEMYSPNGSVGIYRVSTVDNGHGTELTSMELEHAVAEVGNYIVNGEISEELPLNEAINRLWGYYKGSRWRIGSNSFTDRVLVDALYDNLLQALLDLLEQTSGYMMAFDFSSSPWAINIVRKDTVVSAEGRLSRNVEEAHVTYDLTELCTRVYVDYDADDSAGGAVSMDADTISQYGVIEKHVPGSGYTYSQAQAVAREYLEKHKRPQIGATITGVDFASVTGEPLDALAIGKLYRLAVPKHNVVIEQHITGLSWSHLYSDPSAVEIALGVEEDRVVSYMQQTTETVSKGGKGTIKKQGRYWTKFDRTDHYIDQVAAYTDENGNVLKQAGMYIDANGVLQYAQDNEKQIGSQFKVAADQISAEVTQRKNGERILFSTIEQTATQIRSEVVDVKKGLESSITQTASQIRLEVKNTKQGLESSIKQNSDAIALTVKKGDVATQLAVEAGNVSVRNGNLIVYGIVTAAAVKAAAADITDLTVGGVVRAQHFYLGTGALPTAMIDSGTYDLRITQSGNTYTLQKQTFSNYEWQDVGSFSRATSLSGAWSGGKYTVTASPQGNTLTESPTLTLDGNGGTSFTAKLQHSTPQGLADTGLSQYIYLVLDGSGSTATVKAGKNSDGTGSVGSIPVGSLYTSGQNNVAINKGSWSGGEIQFTKSAGTASTKGVRLGVVGGWDGTTYKYTIRDYYDNTTDGVATGPERTIDGSSIYNAGWDDAYPVAYTEIDGGSVSWDSGSISGRKNIGSISRPDSRSYIKFSISCRGATRLFYITVN